MSFLNYEKAASVYKTEPMIGNIKRLFDFDAFHCLRSGSLSVSIKVNEKYSYFPVDYLEWLKICDGGLLFDTVLLSSKEHDAILDLDFDTYEDMNSVEAYSELNLPSGFLIFAMRSYGDPICFNEYEKDGKVYLWDVERGEFSDIWESFADWLTEEIDDAIRLIAEDALDPLDIKLGGNSDE